VNQRRAGQIRSARWFAACCVLSLQACGNGAEFSGALPSPDGQLFVQEVYPLLLRDCAFSGCHGAEDRFFHVYGPGRVRLTPNTTKPDDPMSVPELLSSYDRARSMLATADSLEHSLLLSKPLELEAGGQSHKGVDGFGRNVFASRNDPGYALLLRWANTLGMPPTAAQVEAASLALEQASP
jgi:hypothetical protein